MKDFGEQVVLACERVGVRPQRILVGEREEGRLRVSTLAASPLNNLPEKKGRYVIYWMLQNRREQDNAALAVALLAAKEAGLPLLVIESVRADYPWANARHHSFLAGAVAARAHSMPGYAFVGIGARTDSSTANVKSARGANEGVVAALCEQAPLVVCDWAPWFIFPGVVERLHMSLAARGVHLLLVDDCGLVPLHMHVKMEAAARFLRPKLVRYVDEAARESEAIESILSSARKRTNAYAKDLDLALVLDRARVGGAPADASFVFGRAFVRKKNIAESACVQDEDVNCFSDRLVRFAGVDSSVARSPVTHGGEKQAHERLDLFLKKKLSNYDADRNHPDRDGTSRLSPYLHYGLIHPRSIVRAVLRGAGASRKSDLEEGGGATKFIDEFVTWRELSLNMAHYAHAAGRDLGSLEMVPGWAVKTLRENMGRSEAPLTLEQLESSRSPDAVWNAANNELVRTGTLHNYMRMIWGKGIVRWSKDPEEALWRLEHLNNKYALDGRDPNSYCGILWCLGKFDRPWPPMRPPFGIVRSLSTKAARKKCSMETYLEKFR